MKEELLRLIDAGRAKEVETLVPLVDDAEPAVAGRWTAKDNLAHLTVWREVAIREIDSATQGIPAPDLAGTDDEQNALFYAEMRDVPAREIVERASRSWRDLAGRVAECTEEELEGPRPGHPEQQLWQAVPGNGFGHLADHLGYWYTDTGDESGAEEAAMWGRDLARGLPSAASHANGDYNLGCFYARRGRSADAVPYFHSAFELAPNLREWARTDPDLDPIRAEPEVAALLEG
jgi:hypothetical protein